MLNSHYNQDIGSSCQRVDYDEAFDLVYLFSDLSRAFPKGGDTSFPPQTRVFTTFCALFWKERSPIIPITNAMAQFLDLEDPNFDLTDVLQQQAVS